MLQDAGLRCSSISAKPTPLRRVLDGAWHMEACGQRGGWRPDPATDDNWYAAVTLGDLNNKVELRCYDVTNRPAAFIVGGS
jgi:hypothetical protein